MEFWTRSLNDAFVQLETNYGLVSSSLAKADMGLEQAFRTATIKSFEYCYALAIKAMERTLSERTGRPVKVEEASFRTLIHMAHEMGLVRDAPVWLEFRDMRNYTAHAYDDKKAAEVLAGLPPFLTAIRVLLEKLQEPADAL